MKKSIYLLVLFLFAACEYGDDTCDFTFRFVNNTSGEISIDRLEYHHKAPSSIPVGESLSINHGGNYGGDYPFYRLDSISITCNGKTIIQKKDNNDPIFDTTKYECLFYEKVREPNTCYIITAVYQFEFTDEFFKD